MIISNFPGGGGGAALVDIVRAEALPGAAVNGRLVVISGVAATAFHVGYNLPAAPAAGDIWVHSVDNGFYPVTASDGVHTILLTPGAAMQYVSGAWVYREAYVGVGGQWRMCSTHSPLASLSWTAIDAIASSGEDMAQFFEIGDQKEVVLTTAEVVPVEIVGFAHDNLADNTGKAAITFGSVGVLGESRGVGGDAPTVWPGCGLASWMNTTFFNTLPADLRGAIKRAAKPYRKPGKNIMDIGTVGQQIFAASAAEVGVGVLEGVMYARFTNLSASRVKKRGATVVEWWLRSNYEAVYFNWTFVKIDGATQDNSPGTAGAKGIAPFFCVGRVGV